MQKIISLFQRNYDGDRLVHDEIVPGAEWVVAGEGVATRKWDGVCTMIRDGRLFKRYELKAETCHAGKTPPDWEPADELDANTDKQMGWVPVREGDDAKPEDRFMLEALQNRFGNSHREGGTYEFVGPKSQGNAESFNIHLLVRHGDAPLHVAPRTFEALRGYLLANDEIEGIVWHHPDGRMVKIKAKDFGIKRRKVQVDNDLMSGWNVIDALCGVVAWFLRESEAREWCAAHGSLLRVQEARR